MRKDQQEHIDAFLKEMRGVMITKGSDYSGSEDTLKNLKLLDRYGYDTSHGLLLRMGDKISRLATLLKTEGKPNHESLHDNILDLANYSCLLDMHLKEKAKREAEGEEDVMLP